ncbi:hypothetical protein LTR27_009709 [Elasticomyces elasticus]|nr:hypothetical protein LTR27_009709 [Elasticomyces elasticus]
MMPKRKRQGSDAVTASKRTLRSQTKAKAADVDEQKSAFLALPPELRNRIYEYVLIDPNKISVDANLQIPPLLHVSRQVKTEASGIWYWGNHFRRDIRDCNGELLTRFTQHYRSAGMRCLVKLRIYGRPNWPNLFKWCKQVQVRTSPRLPCGEGFTELETVISSAHEIVLRLRDQPWEKCEAMLEILRRTAGSSDKRWLD